jgi:hypothetical protein
MREQVVAGGNGSGYRDCEGKGIEPLPLARARTTSHANLRELALTGWVRRYVSYDDDRAWRGLRLVPVGS